VYQVPARTTAEGYKASDWNVESFLWKGRLRVLEIGERCELKLEVSSSLLQPLLTKYIFLDQTNLVWNAQDSGTGELFAQVNYTKPYTQVEPVLDSSRYFVLRVEGDGGRRAYIGMGFAERGDAFDFQVSHVVSRLFPLTLILALVCYADYVG
jgi:hypothetical protein